MANYKLYAAVLALACIVLQQEVSCGTQKKPVVVEPEVVDEYDSQMMDGDLEESVEGQEEQHHDCNEYSFKIWDAAFADPKAMALANVTLDTIKEMSANDVCSDTMRSGIRTAEALVTSKNAQYSIRMFFKLLWSIAKKTDKKSDKYKETSMVINHIMTDQRVQVLISNFITRSVNLVKDPLARKRMAEMADSLAFMFKPYLHKAPSKKQMYQNKRAASYKRNQTM